MKKKGIIALALAVVLAAVPVVAGAASSPSGSGSSSGSGGGGSRYNTSVSSGSTITVGTGTVIAAGPSADVSANGQVVTVVNKGVDASGTTVSLVVTGDASVNEAGSLSVGGANVSIVGGAAETAGLPQEVVETINNLNKGGDVASVGLAGYTGVGATRAIVSKNADGADAAAQISMKVDSLVGAAAAGVAYYNNNTGRWEVAQVLSFDSAAGIVTFAVPGSVTVKFAKK